MQPAISKSSTSFNKCNQLVKYMPNDRFSKIRWGVSFDQFQVVSEEGRYARLPSKSSPLIRRQSSSSFLNAPASGPLVRGKSSNSSSSAIGIRSKLRAVKPWKQGARRSRSKSVVEVLPARDAVSRSNEFPRAAQASFSDKGERERRF